MISLPCWQKSKDTQENTCAWVCRDEDGRLWLHFEEPQRSYVDKCSWHTKVRKDLSTYTEISRTLLDEKFKDLTWEDEPIKITMGF